MRAADAVLRYLEGEGVKYVFGNPGTTEIPFMDAFVDTNATFVLCLQENVAVSAADALAQATGRAQVVNLHTGPGVAQAYSAIYMAAKHRAPVVVTAGNEDSRFALSEPLLRADLVEMCRPVVKWAYEPVSVEEVLPSLRRAFKAAQTPPTGPVLLSWPMDVLAREVPDDIDLSPAGVPASPAPDPRSVEQIAALLATANAPCIIAGDDVARTRSNTALVALAEATGSRVYGGPLSQLQSFPNTHPLYAGLLPPFPAIARAMLAAHDVVVVVGARAFFLYYYQPVDPLAPETKLVHAHPDGWEVGKNYRTDVGVISSANLFVDALRSAVDAWPQQTVRAASERRATLEAQGVAAREAAASRTRTEGPLTAGWVSTVVAEMLGDVPVTVVDESVTSATAVRSIFPLADEHSFIGHKGGALGWGAGAAVGAALGNPDHRIVCTLGDGSLMYCPQALYTAARHRLPILYVIMNNAGYSIIKSGTRAQKQRAFETDTYVGMDLTNPELDLVSLARGMGVPAAHAADAGQLRTAVTTALSHEGPFLVDCAVNRAIPDLPF